MADEGPRSRGVVSKFIVSKGYGFIKQLDDDDDGGDGAGDLFFHQSQIKSKGIGMLKKGQFVEFFVVRNGDKIKAVGVAVVNDDRNDSGERNSSGGGGGSNRRNRSSAGGGKCSDCQKIGCMVGDCDKCGGGSSVGGGSGGDSRHFGNDGDKGGGGVVVVEAEISKAFVKTGSRGGGSGGVVGVEASVAKVVGKTDSRVGGGGVVAVEAPVAKVVGKRVGGGGDSRQLGRDGYKAGGSGGVVAVEAPVARVVGKTGSRVGGGGDSRHLGRDGDKAGGSTLAVEAPVAKVVGKTDGRVGGGGGDSRHSGRDGYKAGRDLALKAPVVGKTSNRVGGGGGDSRRLARGSKNVGDALAVKEAAAFAKLVQNISLGGGMRVRDPKHLDRGCDKTGGGSAMDASRSVSGIESGHLSRVLEVETGFAKFDIHNNIGDQRGHTAKDCKDFCYICD